ncbi:hypothetical protein AVEN_23953-1 [Araneus ventricosus]|uniref:Uncharacterized protein n=1 Tax=Araneus ventricosus TaxID=182803 RepID=A0A4Y2QMW7_ARAVE|nr:hypothetical protein AVEN_23953-1 [Araneus ventricosus]
MHRIETRYTEDTSCSGLVERGKALEVDGGGDIADPEDRFYSGVVERRFAVWLPSRKTLSPKDGGLFAKNGMYFSNASLHLSIGSR